MSEPTVTIRVTPKKLSDGSKVFDVHIGNLSFAAVSERNAQELAERFCEAIEDNTNDTAVVSYE